MLHSRFPVGRIDFDIEKGLDESMVPVEGKSVEGIRESVMVQNHVTDKGGAMSWYAVYTKSRHEHKVNTHLIQEGIEQCPSLTGGDFPRCETFVYSFIYLIIS